MVHPSVRIAKKVSTVLGSDNAITSVTITVPSNRWGILWKLSISVDVGSEPDLEALGANVEVKISIGTTIWIWQIHPLITHTGASEHRWVDLGPWDFDFSREGLYSGVKGDNVQVTVGAMGANLKSRVTILYSGD